MKPFTACSLLLILLQSCADEATNHLLPSSPFQGAKNTASYTIDEYNNTMGFYENGDIITDFDCPDAVKLFPPIDLKSWNKTPVVNGRLPTYEETKNGMSIHHYGEKVNPKVKPYHMTLPKLAYRQNRLTKMDDLVVVIQIVQTDEDTIVGFRYLTGGCGGSAFRDYCFLTDEEVRNLVGH